MTHKSVYDEIAADILADRRIVVFCDNATQAERERGNVVDALLAAGVERQRIVRTRRERRLDVSGTNSMCRFVLADGRDGRGLSADVAYLSERARHQREFAALMGGEVK